MSRRSGDRTTPERSPGDAAKGTRDRVRDIIREEVARANPIEDACGPLELIIETSLRYSETDGEAAITVVDERGEPRTVTRNGEAVAFTVQDLIEELRVKHPTLFKPRGPEPKTAVADEPAEDPIPQPEPTIAGAPEHASDGGGEPPTETSSPASQASERDWLHVASNPPAKSARSSMLPRSRTAPDRHRGRAEAGARARSGLRARLGMVGDVGVATLQSARTNLRRSLAGTRNAFETVRARAPMLRWPKVRGVALGALLLLIAGSLIAFVATRLSDRGPNAVSNTETASSNPLPAPTDAPAAVPEPSTTASAAAPGDAGSFRGVPEVLDTSTLWLQDRLIRLYGVEWGRGGSADDLTQYLRGRAVACRPVPGSETYRCEVDGQDLSKVVLFNGGGRTTAEATPDLKAAEEHARSARLGVWAR